MKKLGYVAMGNRGTTVHMTNARKHPRKQLLDKLGKTHADKMYTGVRGLPVRGIHIGYVVGGEWFTVYEVHEWMG